MTEETLAVVQTYRTRRGPELRVRPLRRCASCRQPIHPRQAQPEPDEEQWPVWKIAVTVVMAIGFIYAVVTIGAAVAA